MQPNKLTTFDALKALDQEYIFPYEKRHAQRLEIVEKKIEWCNKRAQIDPLFKQALTDPSFTFRQEYDTLRHKLISGWKKFDILSANTDYNKRVNQLALSIPSARHLHTKRIGRKIEGLLGYTLIASSPFIGQILPQAHDGLDDTMSLLGGVEHIEFPIYNAGLTATVGLIGIALLYKGVNRKITEIRPWDACAYLDTTAKAVRNKDTSLLAYLDHKFLHTDPGVHPRILQPNYKQTLHTQLDVLIAQIASPRYNKLLR